MTWLAIPVLGIFALYYFTVVRRVGLFAADSLFAYAQLLMAVGSFPLLDSEREADLVYGYLLAFTIIAYMVAGFFFHSSRRRSSGETEVYTFQPGFHVSVLVGISALIVVAYYYAVGHVTIFEGFRNLFGGEDSDVTTLRLESYSGSRYLFPGYVNQFKNALLPALALVIFTAWVRRGRVPFVKAAMLWSFTLIGILGTGQRGAFVLFVVMAVVYIYLLDARAFPRRGVGVIVLAVPVLLLSTLALGRSSDDVDSQSSSAGKASVAAAEFGKRLMNDNQSSAVVAFRYIYEGNEIQNGQEWLRSLAGLLPGVRGSDLANRVFALVYGSDRGTAPESIWGSIYHNFGNGGIVVAPFVLAGIAAFITRRVQRSPQRSTLTTVGMAGTITVFGMWVASPPVFLLNNGIVVYIAIWLVGSWLDKKAASARKPVMRTPRTTGLERRSTG